MSQVMQRKIIAEICTCITFEAEEVIQLVAGTVEVMSTNIFHFH